MSALLPRGSCARPILCQSRSTPPTTSRAGRFDFVFTAYFVLGACCVIIAIFLYGSRQPCLYGWRARNGRGAVGGGGGYGRHLRLRLAAGVKRRSSCARVFAARQRRRLKGARLWHVVAFRRRSCFSKPHTKVPLPSRTGRRSSGRTKTRPPALAQKGGTPSSRLGQQRGCVKQLVCSMCHAIDTPPWDQHLIPSHLGECTIRMSAWTGT